MADTKTSIAHAPIWLDLSGDPDKARSFHSQVFGWKIEVNRDPQAGGYSLAKLGGKHVAGIGPKQDPSGPTAWMVYVGTADADETVKKTQSDPEGAAFGIMSTER
jgi:predicted enzyme related to lactoylglutathione lyase